MKIYEHDLVQISFYSFQGFAIPQTTFVLSKLKWFLSLSSLVVYTVGYFEDINRFILYFLAVLSNMGGGRITPFYDFALRVEI